jgi:hypothetical protein
MQNLDPTYLRYIYDNLIKGSLHPENASELPEGLIGLYEEAFEEFIPVLKRQQLLQRFALFALLKKEVSAAFVVEVMDESETNILDFINTYASWFNSPDPGKFQLYHERLKVYVLQKLSAKEILSIHEKLIARLELSIEEQKADEFESYGLEFISEHYYVEAMISSDGQKLIDLTYSQSHWQRQLKISKGYTWTKNGLKSVMTWASKYNEYEVIECGLQMVDLHQQEQNAAPQIVALVAEGDFESALKRIEQFGGNDKEGLKRKFILYMLCLMELTLLDSKVKPFRKEGIEKLLKHLEEEIPVDHSLVNWGEFFSSYLVFLMTCEWNTLNLDFLIVYKRTSFWESFWIEEIDLKLNVIYDVLLKLVPYISEDEEKVKTLRIIIKNKLFKRHRYSKLIDIVNEKIESIEKNQLFKKKDNSIANIFEDILYDKELNMLNSFNKDEELAEKSIKLLKNDQFIDSLICINRLINSKRKRNLYNDTVHILLKKNEFKHSYWFLLDSLKKEFKLYDLFKDEVISKVLINQLKRQKNKKPLEFLLSMKNSILKNDIILDFFTYLNNQRKTKDAFFLIKRYLQNLVVKNNENDSLHYFSSIFMANNNEINLAICFLNNIYFQTEQINSALEVCKILSKKGELVAVLNIINEFELKIGFGDEKEKCIAFNQMYTSFCDLNMQNEALFLLDSSHSLLNQIINIDEKHEAIEVLSVECIKRKEIDMAFSLVNDITIEKFKINVLKSMSIEFVKQDNLKDSIYCIELIKEYSEKSISFLNISIELAKKGNLDDAIKLTSGWQNINIDCELFVDLSIEFAKQGLIEEAILYARDISSEKLKSRALKGISCEIAKRGDLMLSEQILLEIPQINYQYICINEIAVIVSQEIGIENAFDKVFYFNNNEVKRFYLKGCVECLDIETINKKIILIAMKLINNDIESLNHLLQLHSLKQLFFSNLTQEKLEKLNVLLNLQWAIDLKNELDQLPN